MSTHEGFMQTRASPARVALIVKGIKVDDDPSPTVKHRPLCDRTQGTSWPDRPLPPQTRRARQQIRTALERHPPIEARLLV